jgi:hypothetical protein
VQALAEVELNDEQIIAAVEKLIADQGWTNAHAIKKELGAQLKGRWRQATGANWGSRIAASWKPPEWSVDLAKASENDLTAAIPRAKEAERKAIAGAAVSGIERQKLEEAAGHIEELKDRLADAEVEEARLEEAHHKAEAERAELPPGGAEMVMPCPHCGEGVVLRQIDLATRRLEKAEKVPAGELKKRRAMIAIADGAIGRLNSELARQASVVEHARDAMHLALDARHRLAEMPPPSEAGTDIEAAASRVTRAEAELAAWRAKRVADELRDKVGNNDLLLDILAPDGLRAKKLARVVETFCTTQLDPLSEAAGWKLVAVDPTMTLFYGERPYVLCSSSEQYRVRAILQVAMARLDSSDMVVLDAADVLDGPTRSGLFAMLDEAGLPALVCMTLTRREQVPDLAAAELGASYWIEDGLAEPLRHMTEAAA